jgi:hypothetical protein
MSHNPLQTDFQNNSKGLTSPATILENISAPSITWTKETSPRAFYCNAAGSLVLKDAAGNNSTIIVLQGLILPFENMLQVVSGPDVVAMW